MSAPRRLPDAREPARRALWVVAAGCPGFYLFRYGLDDPVVALYAVFGALVLIMFCQVPSAPRERTRTLLATLPVGALLVTAGTLLAVSSWAAACGMFAVGFTVSYCSVGGPRLTGLATAFQLFYVLPCFPPYAPATLGSRLLGLTIGILLTAPAERFLWPEPAQEPYRTRLADAAAAMADCTGAAAERLAAGPGAPPATAVCAAADRALERARLSRVPLLERPVSPAARFRALRHTHAAIRHVKDQLDRLSTGSGSVAGAPPRAPAATLDLLRDTEDALRRAAAALRAGTAEHSAALPGALDAFDAARAKALPAAGAGLLRQDAVVRAVAEGARLATEAARIGLGGRPPDGPSPFAYATTPGPVLWWRRLRMHLTPRSVHLQNALRIATALACARLLAGGLGVSHGFWVLLATLSLMRTSAADTRAALGPAFAGTAVGAAVAAGLLYAVGEAPVFYAVALLLVIAVGFTVCPLLGPAWVQGVFTLAFVLLFTQLSTADWRISEARLVDVLLGGAIGAVASLLAWPHGGQGELRRDMADFLTRGAASCRTVTARLGGAPGPPDPLLPVRHAMYFAEASSAQYHLECGVRRPPDRSWEAVLTVGYDMVHGADQMLTSRQEGPLPPEAAAELDGLAERVAAEVLRAAEALRAGDGADGPGLAQMPPAVCPPDASAPLRHVENRPPGTPDTQVLLIVDAEAWLTGVARAAARIRGAPG
ncbi:FUSC family protein [Streptomyces sp. NPDC051162]|uniref:FUSC family protein n=1 Tax=Streptomyces sp. NPDC051162 TaxID=3154747 RepID=UPI00342AC9DD